MTVFRADTKEAATHRYPTSVLWGAGYFGDGMRYIVADSDQDAIDYAAVVKLNARCVQRRKDAGRSTDWEWIYV